MGGPAFTDVTVAAGIDFTGSYGPVFSSVTEEPGITMQRNIGNGAAVGDYDNDGDLDVYLCGQSGHSNKLLRNDLDLGLKSFTDVTVAAGVDDLGLTRMAHFVDLDNDGLLDLLVLNDDDGVTSPRSRIFRNDGGGFFTDVTAGSNFRPIGYLHCGAALADFNRNGLLDIYVTAWTLRGGTPEMPTPPVFPGSNRLYKNLGGFVFEDVTEAVGLGTVIHNAFTSIFKDFNGDLFPDLYVTIDNGSDIFYWNTAGVFSDATLAVGTTHTGNDMGVACADIDDDGDLDMYVTNITDLPPSPGGVFGTTQFNVLYMNQFDSLALTQFADEAVARGVEDTAWGWGVEYVDAENDGDLDIVAVNGFDEHIFNLIGSSSPIYNTPSVLFINDATTNFTRLMGTGLDAPMDSRALIAFDYDRDGDEDLLISNVAQPFKLFENLSTPLGHWLDVALVQGPGENRDGIGAIIYATIGGVTKRRDIIGGDSYLAGTPPEVHFGLGGATSIDLLRVVWTDGSETTFQDVGVDRFVRISNIIGDCNADGEMNLDDSVAFASALVGDPNGALCTADLNGDGNENAFDIQTFLDTVLAAP